MGSASAWSPFARPGRAPQQASDSQEKAKGKNEEKKFGRGMLEFGIVMTYSAVRYWRNYSHFIEDWQYHLSWKDQKRRFFTLEATRFDSNAFETNWTHAFAGVLYYHFGRANHLSWLESFFLSMAGSLFWEYLVEWREVISINDNILTSLGGYSIGEPWFQIGRYLNSKPALIPQILSFLDPVVKLNSWLDGKTAHSPIPAAGPEWQRFSLFIGERNAPTATSSRNLNNFFFGTHAQINTIPEFGKPGQADRSFKDTIFSEMYLDFTLRDRVEEWSFYTRAVSLGHFSQKINEQGEGYAYSIGLGSAYSFFKKRAVAFYDSAIVKVKGGEDLHLEEPRNFKDKIAAIHIAGPVFDYTAFSQTSRLRLILDAYLDFALVNAFALNKYSIDHSILGIKTTLFYYGYYYGLGTTLSSGLTWDVRDFEFKGLLTFSAYGSIQGWDRFQSELTDDVAPRDIRARGLFSVGYKIPGTHLQLMTSYEAIERWGRIRDVRESKFEHRLFFGLNFLY
jgi:hypothetical protein